MKIQLKRSNQLDGANAKEPTAAQMAYGELAVNYNATDPTLFIKDANDNIIRLAGAGSLGTGTADITLTAGDGLTGGGSFSLDQTVDDTIDFAVDLKAGGGLAIDSGKLGVTDGGAAGDTLVWNGSAWAPAAQTDTNTTYALSDTAVADGAQINLDGSDASQDSFQIVGSGETTVTHSAGVVTISSTATPPNDGQLEIFAADGVTSLGTFTANQAGDTDITLPVETLNTTYTLTDEAVADGAQVNLVGSDTTTDSFQILGSGDTTVTHTDGVITIGSSSSVSANDGQINFNAGDGLTSTGDNATANQAGDTTKTFKVAVVANKGIEVTTNGIQLGGSWSALSTLP